MATPLRSYIFITFAVCCISFAILVTSISTTSWVQANLVSSGGEDEDVVNYGLFLGTLQNIGLKTPYYYTIHLACIPKDNVCAWSCRQKAEERDEEIQNLFTVANASFACPQETRERSTAIKRRPWDVSKHSIIQLVSPFESSINKSCSEKPCNGLYEVCTNGTCHCNTNSQVSEDNTTCIALRGDIDKQFINLGIWSSTLASLILAILFAGISAFMAVVNVAANPVRTIAAIPGLYLWNGLAAFFALLTLLLWGGHFAATLVNNIAIRETITGEFVVASANVGFSYWLILGSFLLHCANTGILFFRRVMLLRIPEPPKVTPDEDTDGAIFLY
ncbi:uncharacterized protein LOC124153797 [Ischnura elegans]|uniref:uncharacterized protein LOC124153797 n=1 Tax=Ischnura elegans TaxID=197161 RepID=UPI001ED8A30D|nr:uncharacterized protein LOC124153797 [Ischnura elegans]